MLYCVVAEEQYNLAYFFVKRIECARATPTANLPYGMFLTRLYRHVMETYPHLDNGIYDLVGASTHRVPLNLKTNFDDLEVIIEGNLCGTWVGYDVLNEAITRVMLHWDHPSAWAWSCGVFALMFSEPCRFYLLKVLPKKWKEISICARKKKTTHNEDLEAQPDSEKYTKTGAENLKFYKRRAQDSLNVHLWQVGLQDPHYGSFSSFEHK
ncbi:ribosomal protein L7Ae/L30e/S12e/Gadd45 [Tanacetum coccineum]